jgi:hypothetical protein
MVFVFARVSSYSYRYGKYGEYGKDGKYGKVRE